MSKHIQVAVAVITNTSGHILLTQRANDKHQGGLWEFPGGKCEPGETAVAALVREIQEELSVEVTASEPLISIPYQYPELHVQLDVFRITQFSGQPHGAEGQPMQWVSPDELDQIPLPPANRPIVRAVQLPDRYLITPNIADADKLYTGVLQAAKQGIRLIQLRAPQLPTTTYFSLVDRLLAELPQATRLLIKGTQQQLQQRPQAGWHLTSQQLGELSQQPRPLTSHQLLAASCHTAAQLEQATKLGCDFATLSPVQPTTSHPDTVALGWAQAKELTAAAQLPVYWLGGMQIEDLSQTKNGGAQGIAAIRGLWPDRLD